MYRAIINDSQSYVFTRESGLELEAVIGCKKDGTPIYRYKYIGNFWPEVESSIEADNNGNLTRSARIKLCFIDDTASESVIVPLKGLEKADWPGDVDIRCLLNPEIPKASDHIANLIRLLCHNATTVNTTVINQLGTHVVDGVPLYCTGDRLIWPNGLENKPDVVLEAMPYRLAVDPDCSEKEAEAGIMRIIGLSDEAGKAIFSFNVLNVFRGAFIKAGINPRCSLFVYGKTGNKKTTFTAFQSYIYNRDEPLEHPPRLNASVPAAVKLLYEKKDCVVILDDLFPAKDREVHRQQEKTLLEITRVIGDGVEPARMRGQKVAKAPPECGVLFTGEYCLGEGSDAARLLPINMAIPIDNDKMTACQSEPIILSTFYSFFIEWLITNFNEVCGLLKEWLSAYRSTKSDIHPRLQETQFCLESAFRLFLTYRFEKGFISKDVMLDEYNSFYRHLRSIVMEQNGRVNQGMGGNPRSVNYLRVISSLYHDRRFRLVESVKDFEVKEHDGIIHRDHIYLRRDRLMAQIRNYEPSSEFDDVLKNLKEQQALKPGKDSNSRKIGGSRLRFYAIKLGRIR